MPPRIKKIIGTLAIVILVPLYALIVMFVGQLKLAESGPVIQLAFFAFFGLLWVIPAALLIRWMERV